MQPRAAHRSRDHIYLVASRDECCDNDDKFVATYRSHALGNICLYGSVSGSRGVARCSRARSCSVAIRDGRCNNIDATSESITFSYIGIFFRIYDMGAFWQPWYRSWFERAQFAWSRFATDAVTITTRHSTTSALIYWRTCNGHRRSRGSRVSLLFERAQFIRRAMRRYTMTMVTVTGSVSVSCAVSVSVFFAGDVARYSRERSCLVAFRDGRRDNDDATSDSITCSYVLIYGGGCCCGVDCCSRGRSYVRYYRDDMLR